MTPPAPWSAISEFYCRKKTYNGINHHPRYIYPILDWEDHPGVAAGVVTGGCVLMPVLVAFWWCLVRLRQWIKEKTT